MESTSVYWIPLFEVLEKAGIEVFLVNGAHAKNVPGRKTDVKDSRWINELHTFGLLRSSFIPSLEMRALRSYVRIRRDHIEMGATHILHMQKALDLMNIKLHNVISQITGVSGIKIIEAILKGERDPAKLALSCHDSIKKKKFNEVMLSLEGNYRDEHLFLLKQAYGAWKFYQDKVRECEKQIERKLKALTKEIPLPNKIDKPKRIKHHKPEIQDLHLMLMQLTNGKDVTKVAGLNDATLLELIGETGVDMTRWPTSKHFVSWCGLAPPVNQSGKTRSHKGWRAKTKAGQVFRLAANSIGQSKYLALKGFYKRIKSRSGPKTATKATARKIAVLYYNILRYGIEYVEEGLENYEKKYKENMQKYLLKKAHELGFELVQT
jgi:transposase